MKRLPVKKRDYNNTTAMHRYVSSFFFCTVELHQLSTGDFFPNYRGEPENIPAVVKQGRNTPRTHHTTIIDITHWNRSTQTGQKNMQNSKTQAVKPNLHAMGCLDNGSSFFVSGCSPQIKVKYVEFVLSWWKVIVSELAIIVFLSCFQS